MNDDGTGPDSDRRQNGAAGWLKGQLSLANIGAVLFFGASLVTWQSAKDFKDSRQDSDIAELKELIKDTSGTYARQDLIQQELTSITKQLENLERKVDAVRVAVR
jgi:hypothetical protein